MITVLDIGENYLTISAGLNSFELISEEYSKMNQSSEINNLKKKNSEINYAKMNYSRVNSSKVNCQM